MKLALVTVTTVGFEVGTIVTIKSFQAQNLWFDGDIIIIHHNANFKILNKAFNAQSTIYHEVGDDLIQASLDLSAKITQFEGRIGQFYSLELLTFQSYDKLLFIDSDVIVRKSLQRLFEQCEDNLLAVGDGPFYQGYKRKIETYELTKDENEKSIKGFSAGVMCFPKKVLNLYSRNHFLSHLNEDFFSQFNTNHSDQLLFNLKYDTNVELISATYNYRIGVKKEIEKQDKVNLEDAHIIHYTGKKKPWKVENSVRLSARMSDYPRIYEMWQLALIDILKSLRIQ